MREHNRTVCTVDGTPLNVQGSVELKLKVGSFTTAIDATVCDIPNIQGILGQDFMANHIKSWDIQNLNFTHWMVIQLIVLQKGLG